MIQEDKAIVKERRRQLIPVHSCLLGRGIIE